MSETIGADTPDFILRQIADPDFRRASFVAASFEMVGAMPGHAYRNRGSIVGVACLEAFMVHVRLLAEFLVRRPPTKKDFTAGDFLWPPPESDAARRLGDQHWDVASKHVVHYSRVRVPDNLADLETVGDIFAYMDQVADDALTVAEEFVAALERYGHPEAERLRGDLDRARRTFEDDRAQR